MTADISTEHPDYERFKPRWDKMNDALGDEDDIRDRGPKYLPPTGGMKDGDKTNSRYDSYVMRARFPEITTQAQTAMTGLIFENDPEGVSDEIITNSGQSNVEFARDAVRSVSSKGKDVFVVDAPVNGGEPFITRYTPESFINWKTVEGNPTDLRLAVFKEGVESEESGEYGHETDDVYRQYRRVNGRIEVSRWQIDDGNMALLEAPKILPVNFMPIITPGSIDLSPANDPIPLLPVARCAISYYQLSADLRMSMHINGNPTPWIKCTSEEQYKQIIEIGIGAGGVWWLGMNEDAEVGFLETTGSAHEDHRLMMQAELDQAETYAVRLTQKSDSAESGVAIARRAAAQHASIYTIARSVSLAVTRAQQMRALWMGAKEPEAFVLDATVDEEYAGEQMINALNSAVNSGNAPQSAIFEAIRKAGLSAKSDDEMLAEIDTQGGLTLNSDPIGD